MADLNIEARVLGIVRRLYLPISVTLSAETRLYKDLHFSEITLLDFRSELEAEFDCTIPDEWLAGWSTLRGAIESVERLKLPCRP